MRYRVTTTWTVEVSDSEVQRASKGYGRDVDPKQLATFKAIERSIQVAMGEGQWDDGVAVYFDVVAVTN
jgi:hypothetical protein